VWTIDVITVNMDNSVMVVEILTVAAGLGQNAVQNFLSFRRSRFEALCSNSNNVMINSR